MNPSQCVDPSSPKPTPSVAASCPRCGYDLEGARAAWKESCPLRSVCSECGYQFEWADILREDRQRVRWLYEHAKHWWSIGRAITTLGAAAWPPFFWRRVQPHAQLRLHRAALWPALLVAVTLFAGLLFTFAVFGALQFVYGTWPPSRPGWPGRPINWLTAWRNFLDVLPFDWSDFSEVTDLPWQPQIYARTQCAALAFNAAALAVCLSSRSHWDQMKVRRSHFFRAFCYGMSPAVVVMITMAVVWSWAHGPTVQSVAAQRWRGRVAQFPAKPPLWLTRMMESPFVAWDDVVILAWLLLWWWATLRIGMRLRRPGIVWLAVAIAGTLAYLAFGSALHGFTGVAYGV